MKYLMLIVIGCFGCCCSKVIENADVVRPEDTLIGNDRQIKKTTKIEAEIIDHVLRSLFAESEWAKKYNFEIFFIKVYGKDPSPEILNRFSDHEIPVLPISKARISPAGVADAQSGKNGILYSVFSIRWIDNNIVEVEAGYFTSGLSASRDIIRLEKRKRGWEVKKKPMCLCRKGITDSNG